MHAASAIITKGVIGERPFFLGARRVGIGSGFRVNRAERPDNAFD
jgi:hypothetical protein